MELNPELQVTIVDVRIGAFKKWTIENNADVTKIDMYLRLLLNKMPSVHPRKKGSSIAGTITEVPMIFASATQVIVRRSQYMCSASNSAPQQNKGIAAKKNPANRSRNQCGFGARSRSAMLRARIERSKGQSKSAAAMRSAR